MTREGYDVVFYGAVLPTMLADSGWGDGAVCDPARRDAVRDRSAGRVGVGGGVPSIPALVTLPLAVAFLPESLAHLRAAGREADARRWAARLGIDPEPGP